MNPVIAGNPNVAGRPLAPVTFTLVTPNPGASEFLAVLKGSSTLSRSGGTSASASSGQGGWQITDRTRQKAATEWLDYYPWVQTMQCFFDGGYGVEPQSVEAQIQLLETVELPVPGSAPPLPPLIIIDGPIHHSDLFSVCPRLSFDGGDMGAIRNDQGVRTQQHFTIELAEYSPSAAIAQSQTPAQEAAIASSGTPSNQGILVPSGQTYIVQQGDNLVTIASRLLGNAQLWTQIALLNGLSNSAILAPGKVLQVPAVSA